MGHLFWVPVLGNSQGLLQGPPQSFLCVFVLFCFVLLCFVLFYHVGWHVYVCSYWQESHPVLGFAHQICGSDVSHRSMSAVSRSGQLPISTLVFQNNFKSACANTFIHAYIKYDSLLDRFLFYLSSIHHLCQAKFIIQKPRILLDTSPVLPVISNSSPNLLQVVVALLVPTLHYLCDLPKLLLLVLGWFLITWFQNFVALHVALNPQCYKK